MRLIPHLPSSTKNQQDLWQMQAFPLNNSPLMPYIQIHILKLSMQEPLGSELSFQEPLCNQIRHRHWLQRGKTTFTTVHQATEEKILMVPGYQLTLPENHT